MGQVKNGKVFCLLLLLIYVSSFVSIPKPHEPAVNLYRAFNMGFANYVKVATGKLTFNRVYSTLDSARGRPCYSYLAFFDTGLMFSTGLNQFSITKKTYWQWSTYVMRGDTIIVLKYELPNLNSRALYYMLLYQTVGDSCIKSISNAIVIDESQSFEQNFSRVVSADCSQINLGLPYLLTAEIQPPPPRSCKFLRHAYFWQSDSLYNEYKNNKIEIQ
jgi:hypothetical protein